MIIGSKNVHVRIVSESPSLDSVRRDILSNKLLYKFIPDFGFKKGSKEAILRVEDDDHVKVDFSLEQSAIKGKYGTDFHSTDIIVMAEYLLERLRQEQRIYTIHSSSVFKGKKAILFFANLTGAGKTSLALYLTQKYGYRLFSDEKTLVNLKNGKLVGQTKKIFLEKKTQANLEEANIKLPDTVNIAKAEDKKLVLLVVPVIVSTAKKAIIHQYSKAQLKWALYEEFSKDIRLVNGLVFNLSYPLLPLDTFKIAKQRERFVEDLSARVPCYCVRGALDSIADKVDHWFTKISSNSVPPPAK